MLRCSKSHLYLECFFIRKVLAILHTSTLVFGLNKAGICEVHLADWLMDDFTPDYYFEYQ